VTEPAPTFHFYLLDLLRSGWNPSLPGRWLEVAAIHAADCPHWRGEPCACLPRLEPVTDRELSA